MISVGRNGIVPLGNRQGQPAVKIQPPDAGPTCWPSSSPPAGDATWINSVSYSIEDDSQLVKDARARAFQDAKNRAEQYAQLSGLTLGQGDLDLGGIRRNARCGAGSPDRRARQCAAGTRPADGELLGDRDLAVDLMAYCG